MSTVEKFEPVGYVCPLTDEQMSVAQLAAAGMSNKQIAHELGLSAPNVGNISFAAYKACGAKNRAHLIAILFRKGWIS